MFRRIGNQINILSSEEILTPQLAKGNELQFPQIPKNSNDQKKKNPGQFCTTDPYLSYQRESRRVLKSRSPSITPIINAIFRGSPGPALNGTPTLEISFSPAGVSSKVQNNVDLGGEQERVWML